MSASVNFRGGRKLGPRTPMAAASMGAQRGRVVQTFVCAGLGLPLAAGGLALHAPRLALGDGRLVDVVGSLVGIAGLGLVVRAFQVALRGRSWRWKAAALPVALLLVQFYVFPVVVAGLAGNANRLDLPPAASLGLPGARDVRFPARDGVELAGWYVPGHRPADIVLAHGSHGSRKAVEGHLRLLARLGYGVLAFDARGHGESDGDPNALGWRGADDIAGAVQFLRRHSHAERRRLGLVGISMGGEEAIRAASEGIDAAAVVADGAGGSTTGDARAGGQAGLELAVGWLGMRATELLLGDAEPASLVSRADRVDVPTFLIASNAEGELEINQALAARIGSTARVWHLGDVGHTQGFDRHPAEYAKRVGAFLDEQL